ncbi:MAG: HDIG domain-containing metalloprotein [Bacteroidota bacterium]
MGILERLGLGRKTGRRPSRVGLQLSTAKPKPGRRMTRNEVLVRVGIFGTLLLLTTLAFPNLEPYEQGTQVQPGDVWQRQEVIAPFRFPVYKSEAQLRAERDSVRYEEPPLFVRVPDAAQQTEAAVDSLDRRFESFLQAYVNWQQNRSRGQAEAAQRDSVQYGERLVTFQRWLSRAQVDLLVASYAARAGLATTSRANTSGPALHDLLTRAVGTVSSRLLPFGMLDVPKDSVLTSQIALVDAEERTETLIPKEDVYGLNEGLTLIRNELRIRFPNRPDAVEIGMAFVGQTLQTSLQYMREESEARWQEAAEDVSQVTGVVEEGQSVVRRGDRVTEEVQRQLYSLARIRADQQGNVGPLQVLLGETLLSLAAFLIFFLYLFLMRRRVFYEARYLLLIGLVFAAIIGFFGVAVRLPEVADLAVPVGLASILLTVIFDSRVGMFATITLACIGGLIFGYNFEFTFATIFAGMLAVFSVRDVKNRSQIILTAALVFGAYALILGGYFLLRAGEVERLLSELSFIGINSILLLLAYPLLWIFERTFGVTTDLTLLELSDTNRPLLKELSLRAPGTFNHVLQVANLAEAAADAVGANVLQARVGALYHDVGKMIKPEYYIENQQGGENPHDRVTPYMSALVIASHVKDGLDLAQQENLPEVVRNFIPTHHGTTMMEFFYRKAEELRGPEDPPVDEMEFRYPGPRPQTNEHGIVMLADSVEAASRSLDKPTPKRLEGLVDDIFRARIEDGQLDGCALTFADLNRIKEAFLSILNGIYHLRVKYPDQDKTIGAEEADAAPTPAEEESGTPEVPQRPQDVPARPDGASGGTAGRAQDPSTEERASLG